MKLVDDGIRPCPIGDPTSDWYDPETCSGSQCEIERDADHEFWECEECGYAFGHRLADQEGGVRITPTDDSCQAGIPEAVRRQFTPDAPGGRALLPVLPSCLLDHPRTTEFWEPA